MRADELAAGLGVVKSTMANKAARIRKILDLSWFEPELMRRSMLEQHPLTWLVEVNGIPVDARWLPQELQDEARRLGLIPDLGHPQAA
jgi:purine nucleoside permease